jgi:Tol biopolymer transport system component
VVSIDLARGTSTRLTGGTFTNRNGIWSRDGHSIAFSSDRAGYYDIYVKAADPDAPVRAVWKSALDKHVNDWSADGNYLLVTVDQPRTGRDVWVLPLNGKEKPWSLVRSEGLDWQAQFSPDGKWVAYASDETGPSEIFVRPFRGGPAIRVSTAGGRVPTWSADGRELLFSTPSGQVMLADIRVNGPMIEAGVPKTLFSNPRMWQAARLMFDGNILIGERVNESAELLNVTTAWRARAP